MKGGDWLKAIKLRINALPTRSRTARGRVAKDRHCRAGCQHSETLNHVLQQCYRTHATRIKRHDRVVAYIARKLEVQGNQVIKTPKMTVNDTTYIPDLVVTKEGTSTIIDAQIVTDAIPLDTAHDNKREKYSTDELHDEIRRRFHSHEVKVTSVTLNWRGIWSRKSVRDLLEMKVIKTANLAVITARVLEGGLIEWSGFNKDTCVWRRRPPN